MDLVIGCKKWFWGLGEAAWYLLCQQLHVRRCLAPGSHFSCSAGRSYQLVLIRMSSSSLRSVLLPGVVGPEPARGLWLMGGRKNWTLEWEKVNGGILDGWK